MIKYNLISRNLNDATAFVKTYKKRIKAKHDGDKRTSSALKLPLNTTYGAMINEYNDLYDPRQGRGVCITGQLFITDLSAKYLKVPTVDIIQINTDGVMIYLDEDYLKDIHKINEEWCARTGFELEEDKIRKIVQRDCNNYIIEMTDGHLKYKGGALSDYDKKDYWKHHSLSICAEALAKKLIYDTPIEDTINDCQELDKFQMITKTGRTYNKAVRVINNQYVDIQRVNRVFASKDESLGTLYKVKTGEKERYDKVADCPISAYIDGYDTFTIDDIDKNFYIDLTIKRYKKFIGGEENDKKTRKRRSKNGE